MFEQLLKLCPTEFFTVVLLNKAIKLGEKKAPAQTLIFRTDLLVTFILKGLLSASSGVDRNAHWEPDGDQPATFEPLPAQFCMFFCYNFT